MSRISLSFFILVLSLLLPQAGSTTQEELQRIHLTQKIQEYENQAKEIPLLINMLTVNLLTFMRHATPTDQTLETHTKASTILCPLIESDVKLLDLTQNQGFSTTEGVLGDFFTTYRLILSQYASSTLNAASWKTLRTSFVHQAKQAADSIYDVSLQGNDAYWQDRVQLKPPLITFQHIDHSAPYSYPAFSPHPWHDGSAFSLSPSSSAPNSPYHSRPHSPISGHTGLSRQLVY